MKNIEQLVINLENHKMFSIVDRQYVKKLIYNNHIIAYRNDGIGSRLMSYINLVRLSKKYKCNFSFYWDTRSDKNSPSYPHNVTSNICEYLPNLKNIKFYNSKFHKFKKKTFVEWKIVVLKGEKKTEVLKECHLIAKKIFSKTAIKVNNSHIFQYGLHIRLGDIDAHTNRNYNKNLLISKRQNFNLGKWYPNIFWEEISNKISGNILVSSSDYRAVKKIFKFKKNITYSNDIAKKKTNETYKYIFDIILISKSKNIICSLASGTGLVISLLSKNKVFAPESFLKFEKIFFEFYSIIYFNFIKFNSLKSLIFHNISYFTSKIVDFRLNVISRIFKKEIN